MYALIQEGGLEGYYRLQDRAAEPLKDRRLDVLENEAFRALQLKVEASSSAPELILPVDDMSCMGCAWLIERLARREAGLESAQVSLVGNRIALSWKAGIFDLAAFALVLMQFGYRLQSRPVSSASEPKVSPLAMRVLLVCVFWFNSVLLAGFVRWVPTVSARSLVSLLSLACVVFAVLIGVGPYFLSVSRSAQIRRLHSDLLPLLCLLLLGALLTFGVLSDVVSLVVAGSLFILFVFLLTVARWLAACLRRR